MNLVGKKVLHKDYGIGEIVAQEKDQQSVEQGKEYLHVDFSTKKSVIYKYPDSFEKFLQFEDETLQSKIKQLFIKKTIIDEPPTKENPDTDGGEKVGQNEVTVPSTPTKRDKDIDSLLSAVYNAKYLARNPILPYEEVENQFGIKIRGFGRGINISYNTIVLISAITKSKDSFVYHDKWTEDGDYIYSGEGKKGDQTLTKGNYAIINTKRDGKVIHLFVKFSSKEYYYQGVFELVDYNYEDEKDEDGNMRKEYKFLLRKVPLTK